MSRLTPTIAAAILVASVIATPSFSAAAEKTAPPATWVAGDQASAQPAADADEKPQRLGFLQRRRLGLTVRNIAQTVRELKAEGEWSDDAEANRAAVLARIIDRNPEAWVSAPKIDWDGIAEFLERIMPLILQLIEIFGGL